MRSLAQVLARVRAFFNAPVVIFHLNILSYFSFLCLFAYVLMVDFQPSPSWCERLIYLWLFSLVCEELRQVRPPLPCRPCGETGGVSLPTGPLPPATVTVSCGPWATWLTLCKRRHLSGPEQWKEVRASCLPASPLPPSPHSLLQAGLSRRGQAHRGRPRPQGTPFSLRQSGGHKGPGCSHGAPCPTLQLPGSGAWHPAEGVGTPARLSWSLQGLPLLVELQAAGGPAGPCGGEGFPTTHLHTGHLECSGAPPAQAPPASPDPRGGDPSPPQ